MHGAEARSRKRGHLLGVGAAWHEVLQSDWGEEGSVHPGMSWVAWHGKSEPERDGEGQDVGAPEG